MIKSICVSVSICLAALGSYAQSEQDAINFTGLEYGGSARFVAMGSSMGALGGDISVLSTNPAGLGLYRRAEFTLSPTFVTSNSTSLYEGNKEAADDLNFTLNNIGYVQTYPSDNRGWKMVQFGIGVNRLKDFHSDYLIEGKQAENSYLDFVSGQVNANSVQTGDLESFDPFVAYPAYETYLINPIGTGANILYIDTIGAAELTNQKLDLRSRGRLIETVVSGSGNYMDRLYVGFGLGFQRIVKEQELLYQETFSDTMSGGLDNYSYVEDLEVSGNGFNIRIGAILKATESIRLGASYVSPTWYNMSNTWESSISSRFNDGSSYSAESAVIGLNEYNLRTPSRMMGSVGFVLAKQALLNLEYEYVDYANAKFSSSSLQEIDFSPENKQISTQYVSVGNLRAGGEYRYRNLSLRGGVGYYPSPHKEGSTVSDGEKMMYSGGIGFTQNRMKLDLGYRVTTTSSDYYIYSPDLVNPAQLEDENHMLVITYGLRF